MAASDQTILTFAYGSNMLTARLRARCPSAAALGVATLHGHELRWHKQSVDGSGKCSIMPTDAADAAVYGVLYKINATELPALDQAEGLGRGYTKEDIVVVFGNEMREASVYVATKVNQSLKPYTWYKALVIGGAIEHGLPAPYAEWLAATEAIQDLDTARHEKNMQFPKSSERCP